MMSIWCCWEQFWNDFNLLDYEFNSKSAVNGRKEGRKQSNTPNRNVIIKVLIMPAKDFLDSEEEAKLRKERKEEKLNIWDIYSVKEILRSSMIVFRL